jgi:hypothetical protein
MTGATLGEPSLRRYLLLDRWEQWTYPLLLAASWIHSSTDSTTLSIGRYLTRRDWPLGMTRDGKKTQETLELVQQKQNDFAGGPLPLPGHVVPRGHLVEFYCWSKGVELVSPINARFWWVPPSLLLHLKSKWCLNQGLKNSKLPWEKWVISDHQAAQRLRASNKFFMHEVFDRPQVLGRLGGEAAGFATAIRVPGPAATHHQTVGWPSNGCRGIHPIIFTIP